MRPSNNSSSNSSQSSSSIQPPDFLAAVPPSFPAPPPNSHPSKPKPKPNDLTKNDLAKNAPKQSTSSNVARSQNVQAPPPLQARRHAASPVPPPVIAPPQISARTFNLGTDRLSDQSEQQQAPRDFSLSGLWQKFRLKVRDYLESDTRRLPSWLVSMCVHVGILLILALIPVLTEPKSAFNLFLQTGDGLDGDSQDPTFELSTGEINEDDAFAAESLLSSETLEIAMIEPTLDSSKLEVTSMMSDFKSAITMGLSGRSGDMKNLLLGAYGGSAETENAVKLGLEWLVRNQGKDGTWSLQGKFSDNGTSACKPAATAMALIAFAGAGHTHKSGEYQQVVTNGFQGLLKLQSEDGAFYDESNNPTFTAYAQAQATIALCELYGMTGDTSIRAPAQRALDYCQSWQDPSLGGWRYRPRDGSDLSVTGWYIMAIMSGRMAGLSTDDAVLKRGFSYLDVVQHDGGATYAYTDYSRPILSMTAEGLLCRMYQGWTATDPRIRRGAGELSRALITTDINQRDYYYWYYATQTMHHIGNPQWDDWNAAMKEQLPALQQKAGRESGSWPPQGDAHGSSGGRLYSTCFAIYCLEVYYRHLPLYGHSNP